MESPEMYKIRKEQFYAGHSGGSTFEILAVSAVTPCSIFCIQVVELCCGGRFGIMGQYVLSLLFVVFPMYFSFVAPQQALTLISAMLISALVALRSSGAKLRDSTAALEDIEKCLNVNRIPFITAYRGTMMLATCIAILAVDFENFPRRLAKTETYGVSLMDAGVGSVLLTQAMVSPLVRSKSPVSKRIMSALTSASPLLLIGAARLAGTTAADYHNHVSEYGVHWNFFFTLAIISIVAHAAPFTVYQSAIGALVVKIAFECLSSQTGLKDFILQAPRVDIFSANREGIFGCIGYLTIFYCGAVVGTAVVGKKRSGRGWIDFCLSFSLATGGLWALRALLLLFGLVESRRLANVTYVVWTIAYNLAVLCMFFLGEMLLHWIKVADETTSLMRLHRMAQGDLLSESMNRNLLAMFLLGNVLTGVVNMSLSTIDASPIVATCIMLIYASLLVAISMWLNHARITLKFW